MEGEGDRRSYNVLPAHLPSSTQQEVLNHQELQALALGPLELAGTCTCTDMPFHSSESPSVHRETNTYMCMDTGVHEPPIRASAAECKRAQTGARCAHSHQLSNRRAPIGAHTHPFRL